MSYFNQNSYYPQLPNQLTGKIVDGVDVVRAAEVPFGGYGVFPKADFSEVYIKTWNANGTSSVLTFQKVQEPNKVEEEKNLILEKLEVLESKIGELAAAKSTAAQTPVKEEKKYGF